MVMMERRRGAWPAEASRRLVENLGEHGTVTQLLIMYEG